MSLAQATKGDVAYQVRSLVRIRVTVVLQASPRYQNHRVALLPCFCSFYCDPWNFGTIHRSSATNDCLAV